jgi:hypothetical protein
MGERKILISSCGCLCDWWVMPHSVLHHVDFLLWPAIQFSIEHHIFRQLKVSAWRKLRKQEMGFLTKDGSADHNVAKSGDARVPKKKMFKDWIMCWRRVLYVVCVLSNSTLQVEHISVSCRAELGKAARSLRIKTLIWSSRLRCSTSLCGQWSRLTLAGSRTQTTLARIRLAPPLLWASTNR